MAVRGGGGVVRAAAEATRWLRLALSRLEDTRPHSRTGLGYALLGGVVVAGRPSEHAALLVGRATRRRSRGRFRRLAKATKVARDALRFGDRSEQTHAPVAARACEHVEAERALQQLGPRATLAANVTRGGKSKQSTFRLMRARFVRFGGVGRGVGPLEWPVGTVTSWAAGAGGPRVARALREASDQAASS